jgi:beta-glucosidase
VTPLQGIRAKVNSSITEVVYANSSQVELIQEIAERCDIVIIFLGMMSTEGNDRPNLSLPPEQDRLVNLVAELSRTEKIVVVLNIPGATLLPWIDDVPAIVIPFFPGQEDGNAIADILFGDINPSGKLPITFPVKEDEVPTDSRIQYPGIDNVEVYSEGLDIGYRWYERYNVRPLFPFGHGLSYTTFSYNSVKVSLFMDKKKKLFYDCY